jgi:hypothetical protein
LSIRREGNILYAILLPSLGGQLVSVSSCAE